MRIAFVLNMFPTLSETFILNQITGLIDRGHKVDIFSRRRGDTSKMHPDVLEYKLLDKTYYSVPTPRNYFKRLLKAIYLVLFNLPKGPLVIPRSLNIFHYGRKAASLRQLYMIIPFLGRDKYDVIHCHFGTNGVVGATLKELSVTKGKLVTMFHGYDIRLGIKKGPRIYRQLFKQVDCILSISDYNYRNLLSLGVNSQKIIYHPVGIDLNHFPFRMQKHNLNNNPIKIITVARLTEEKGLEYGIKAIDKVLQKRRDLELQYLIIGDGVLKESLKELVNRLGLENVVQFLGPLDQLEVSDNLKKVHIFLLPSITEALPVVLMEAQATGLPVVATSVGSVDQVILDGKSGFLVPEKNIDALAEKLICLIEQPELRLEMGREGRAHVEAHYDIDKLNDRLIEIYQQTIKTSGIIR